MLPTTVALQNQLFQLGKDLGSSTGLTQKIARSLG
jgi:hypothetical protein